MPDLSHYLPITDPTLIFFVVLCIILLAPIIMGKLRIPHIVGMVLAGMLIGKYGMNILERDSSFELFGEVGLYYIMFLAGLEIDMNGLKNNSWKVAGFGLLTFAVPFVLVFLSCLYMLHYSAVASLLLGSVLGSNTLIAYPIVCKYGLQKHGSVTLCVGASMISVTFALVVLAAIVGTYNHGAGLGFWLLFILKFAVYIAAAIYCIPRITRWFLRRYSDAVMQYIFIMGILFLSAAITDMLGMEGVFGAFFAGLMLNRYIPHVSPLMNRLEFIGNALFIPYFLIGVGMLINMRVLFEGWSTAFITFCLVFFGTAGKALAAYITSYYHRLPRVHGDMMFGLTAAHAAGSIAIVMVGIKLKVAEDTYLLNDDMLNGVVMMILFTCIIGSMVTEKASRDIVLNDMPASADDNNRLQGQERGKALLEKLANMAIAADVRMLTQVRIATNITNGIKHAFKEFNASEIIMGLHNHKNVSKRFWGEFIQSLFNGLNRQIIIVQCNQPLSTIRRIQVAVPSRAEFEPGFCRWMERVARMAGNLDCKIEFHGQQDSLSLIRDYIQSRHPNLRAEYTLMAHWIELPALAASIRDDHMFVVITARKGTVSYKAALEQLPEELTRHFSGKSLMIIYPDQYGEQADAMTFAAPQHQEEQSAYDLLMAWVRKKLLNK